MDTLMRSQARESRGVLNPHGGKPYYKFLARQGSFHE